MGAAAAVLLAALAAPARAHDYPIKPVSVVLRVEPDRVVADVDSDSVYWIEEVVGLHPMPPRDWPADALAKAEKYVNEHLRLAVPGRLIEATYVQRPWEVNENGRVHLRLVYPLPADARSPKGEIDFFEEYRRERLEGHEPLLPSQDFRTLLSVPGRVPRSFELKPGETAFSVPIDEARRSGTSLLAESLRAGFTDALGTIEGWPVLFALALSLAPGVPEKRRLAALALGGIAGLCVPLPGPSALAWAAGLAAALAAGRWLGAAASPWLEAASLAALIRSWMAQTIPHLPRAHPTFGEYAFAAAGIVAAAAAVLAAGVAAFSAERRRLDSVSQSRAADLFERRRRLAATALALVCGGGLAASFPGGAR